MASAGFASIFLAQSDFSVHVSTAGCVRGDRDLQLRPPAGGKPSSGQRFKDFELIVVDDGATEETRQLLASYGSRLRCLYQDNLGPSAARNVGARHAQGAWRAFQDPDHLSAPNHLELLYRHAQEGSDFAMVLANGEYLGGSEHSRDQIIPAKRSRALAARGVALGNIFDKSIVRLQASLISKRADDGLGGPRREFARVHGPRSRAAVGYEPSSKIYRRERLPG